MRLISVIRYLFLALFLLAVSSASFAQVSIGISVGFAPPPIPVYEQPICPHEGYIWTPGYWGWDPEDEDYYWVPGTWVAAPDVGYLWTPGYWGWRDGGYYFYEGYWGPHVGWYGGINYGFGYFGHGYEGGRWDRDRFYYNRSVTNVNITEIHNVYNTTIINRNETRVSYNGGDGGIRERPSRDEENYSRERHIAPVSVQHEHVQEARGNRELRASVNQGRPPIAATQRPGSFRGSAVVPAKEAGGRWEPPANRRGNDNAGRPDNNATRPSNGRNNSDRPLNARDNGNRPPNAVNNSNRPPFSHAREITPHDRPAPPNTGNPRQDQKYQQQQDKLYRKQEQEHQKLQQRQEQDHQRLAQQNANDARRQQVEQRQAQQNANDARRQQMEQRHLQQTQQMEQRHTQQQQRQQEKQQPRQQQQPRGQSEDRGKPNRP